MTRIEWPGNKRQLAVLAVIALLVTAGCAGLGSPDQTGDDTADTDDPEDPADGNESNDPNETDGNESTPQTETVFDSLSPVEEDVSGEEVLLESADALGAVETYLMEERTTSRTQQNNQELTIQINRTVRVDRPDQQLAIDLGTEVQGQTTSTDQVLQNDTLYQRSRQIAQQYGTEWLRTNVSETFEQQYQQLDQAARIEQLLNNASATIEGQTEIGDQQAYAVTATVNTTAVTDVRPTVVNTDRAELRLWISTETMRPIQIVENSTITEASLQGDLKQELDRVFEYSYVETDITVPDAAKNAPFASEVTQ